jgi:hypothetical protein
MLAQVRLKSAPPVKLCFTHTTLPRSLFKKPPHVLLLFLLAKATVQEKPFPRAGSNFIIACGGLLNQKILFRDIF